MENNKHQPKTARTLSTESNPYKKLDEFFESSPNGLLNKDVVLQYVNLLVSAMHQGQHADSDTSHRSVEMAD